MSKLIKIVAINLGGSRAKIDGNNLNKFAHGHLRSALLSEKERYFQRQTRISLCLPSDIGNWLRLRLYHEHDQRLAEGNHQNNDDHRHNERYDLLEHGLDLDVQH